MVADSRDVAATFGKRHDNVVSDIRGLIASEPKLGASNFGASSYRSEQGKELPCFEIDRDGFSLLAMGFTGEKVLAPETFGLPLSLNIFVELILACRLSYAGRRVGARHGQIRGLPDVRRKDRFRPVFGLRRHATVAPVVDRSGPRDLRARCA
jgi:Rha family phage regulatory protein